jgi:iron complex outermembrane receptor protein
VNAKVGVRKGNIKLDVWTRNLLDADYTAFYFESFGNPYMQKGKPFQVGAEVSVAF